MGVFGLLNKTCTIRRPTQTQSGTTGAVISTYADASTGVACAVSAARGTESIVSMRETGQAFFDVYFAHGTDVRNGDRLTSITDFGTNAHLAVTSPPVDGGGRATYAKVTATWQLGDGLN